MTPSKPVSFVIFGGGGDLAWRKLIPALFNLWLDGHLGEQFQVTAVDGKEQDPVEYLKHLRDGIAQFSRQGAAGDQQWDQFSRRIAYVTANFDDSAAYQALASRLGEADKTFGGPAERIFYLATPPTVVQMIVGHLGQAGLTADRQRARVVCEKPFGHDLESACELNKYLTGQLDESQIYRIDHYLGKETVQNMIALRFANSIYEPTWNRRYIDHVQITVAESVGVEHRGGYYDHSGALRDMIQNHLLQVVCMVAMESPISFDADEIRNKKVDVLRAVRRWDDDDVMHNAVRGQYAAGYIDGQKVPGYREEDGVDPHSSTETFAALKLYIDNWRWQGVPFYLRTGKRLAGHASEVCIQFNPVPHMAFPRAISGEVAANQMLLQIQPEEGVVTRFQAKRPGTALRLETVETRFSYKESFDEPAPEGYETLLLDVTQADATLFMRGDQVEQAWQIVMPVLDHWQSCGVNHLPAYAAGSWGPEIASALIARDGRVWTEPSSLVDEEK